VNREVLVSHVRANTMRYTLTENLYQFHIPNPRVWTRRAPHDAVIRKASKVEFHQRKLVDCSDPTYRQLSQENQEIPPTGSWWIVQDPAFYTPIRLDLNNPLTAVSGIPLRTESSIL